MPLSREVAEVKMLRKYPLNRNLTIKVKGKDPEGAVRQHHRRLSKHLYDNRAVFRLAIESNNQEHGSVHDYMNFQFEWPWTWHFSSIISIHIIETFIG